jgi:hypothetical protein
MKNLFLFKVIFLGAVLSFISAGNLTGQSFASGKMKKYTKQYGGIQFTIYKFSRSSAGGTKVKAKYFARNANCRFNSWKTGKKILLACSGAFSVDWTTFSPPLGLCIDNGYTVNKNLVINKDQYGNSLDGLVIVYGGGEARGGIAMKDIEKGRVCTKLPNKCYDIKNNIVDRYDFIDWAERNNATVFQLPLMYSNEYGKNFGSLFNGNKAERRFLALCEGHDNVVYHLIIDVPGQVYMNYSADKIIDMLEYDFKTLYSLVVLDTGGKNILYEYMYGYASKKADVDISEATNLIIYYFD